MSTKVQVHFNVKNATGARISLTSDTLTAGTWPTPPPAQIAPGTVSTFMAQGVLNRATGTSGAVAYLLGDNVSTMTINFDAEYYYSSWPNSGSLVMGGTSPNNYCAAETDSTYLVGISFPTTGNNLVVYYNVADYPQGPCASMKATDALRQALGGVLPGLSATPANPTFDIVTVARATDCGLYPSKRLLALFKGATEGTVQQLLLAQQVPAVDRVLFASNQGLLADRAAFGATLDFAAHVLPVLNGTPTFDTASKLLAALRGMTEGQTSVDVDGMALALEEAKGVLLAQRDREPVMARLAAIDAVLAGCYHGAGAALTQAGSCARATARHDKEKYEAIARWQLAYLKKLTQA
jgi:hypothetical protein